MEILILILTPAIAAISSFFVKRKQQVFLEYIILLATVIEFFTVAKIIYTVLENGSSSLAPYFFVDSLGAILLLIIAIVGFTASVYSIGYLRAEVKNGTIGFSRVRQYHILLHSFLFTMLFAVQVASPILMWVAVEATTLSTAFLISFYSKKTSIEAAWKYLVINSVGLLLAFLGTLIFLASISLHETIGGFVTWQDILLLSSSLNPAVIKIAFVFLLVGYGTKMGLVPMHTWLPDAHSKAPVPISSLLSGVLLNVALYSILRFKIVIDTSIDPQFTQNLMLFFGMISILFAGFMISVSQNYKRLLAYSSIEHMGLITLGFGFGGIGIYAALLHMVYHALTKSLLFLSAGNIFLKYNSTKIADVRGTLTALPITSILFIAGILSIIGMPPFGIFLTEFYILSAGISAHPIIVTFAIIGLAIAFVGFMKHISTMLFGEVPAGIINEEEHGLSISPLIMIVIILFCIGFVIPPFLQSLILNSVKLFS
ncbi:hydrogenase 4 subunit F [Patescibacteria group bacterium]|nr:hydrogenase 4 subunit F [Patescibacteria group bacterium]